MTVTDAGAVVEARVRVAGTVGLIAFVGFAVILGVHPFGTTALYDDGVAYVSHVSPFFVTIHVAAGALFVLVPFVVATYARRAATPWGDAFGRIMASAATIGSAIAIVHLVGTDTVTFAFYADTLAGGGEAAEVGADVLLRLHAATLTAWIVAFFLGFPAAGAAMAWVERERGWRLWLPALAAVTALASLIATLAAGQYTFLSEMVLFRSSATLLFLWWILASWKMRSESL